MVEKQQQLVRLVSLITLEGNGRKATTIYGQKMLEKHLYKKERGDWSSDNTQEKYDI